MEAVVGARYFAVCCREFGVEVLENTNLFNCSHSNSMKHGELSLVDDRISYQHSKTVQY